MQILSAKMSALIFSETLEILVFPAMNLFFKISEGIKMHHPLTRPLYYQHFEESGTF